MFWLGMNSNIGNVVTGCSTCMDFRNKRPPEPMVPHEVLGRPWSKLGTDLFEMENSDYLILIDHYWKFPEVVRLPNKTDHAVVNAKEVSVCKVWDSSGGGK